jgi:biopolymer transport protein ExbD
MGANLGTGNHGRRVDCELNLVPMIDLLTCLTAFLLITSVWTSASMVDATAKPSEASAQTPTTPPPKRISLLVEADRIWIADDARRTAEWIGHRELPGVLESLRELDPPRVEVAGLSTDAAPVGLQQLLDVMQTARDAGYRRVGLTELAALTTPPAS